MRARRILLSCASNVLFHVGRIVVLARELQARGHRIHLAGGPRYLQDPEIVRPGEFSFHMLPDFSPEEGMQLLRSLTRVPQRRRIESLIAAECGLLEELRPDLTISDFRPTLGIAARARGLALAALQLGHWTPEFAARPDWVPRTYPLVAPAHRLLGDRIAARLTPPIFGALIRAKTRPFRAAARARGGPAPPLLWDYLRGDLNLLTDVEALCPGPLPPRTHRVGPILWEPDAPLPDWFERLEPGRPVLLVNYGSTAHPDLFRRTLEELGGTRYQVILATCRQVEFRAEEIPPNFFVETFVPMRRVLERVDLAIYHGGAGTLHQTLRAGVPGLVIATHWDQEHAGIVTERHRLGHFLTMRQVLARRGLLAGSVAGLMGRLSFHRDRARELQPDLLELDGPKTAAEHVERFLAGPASAPI